MPLVLYPDPLLARKAEPRPLDDGLRAIGARLLAAATAANAYGLAAAHIGAAAPVVVVSTAADPARREFLRLFNPVVVSVAENLASDSEGSVSLPGIQVDVARPVWAEIDYQDEHAVPHRRRFEGPAARIALHEIDQMNGIFFLSRVSRLKREMALRKWKKRAG